MKKTHLLLAIMIMAFSLPATAQWSIGASGGYALNFYEYDPQYMVGMDYKAHHGFEAGFPVKYQFNDWLALSSGGTLQQKGYVLHGSYVPVGFQEPFAFYPKLIRNDYYVCIPAMAEFVFGNEKWKGVIGLGGYAGLWSGSVFAYKEILSIKYSIDRRYIYKSVKLNRGVDRRLEFGLAAELGMQRSLGRHLSLLFLAKCHYALTPQQLDYQIQHFPSRNTTVSAQIGIMYHFNNQ